MKLATRIIRIYRVFSYPTFQRMQLYGQNGSVSIIVIKEILLFNVIGLMLCTGIENGCYEHIPLVKSGEGKQWIQLKRILIKGLVPTPNTIVQHFFRLAFRRRRMVSSLFVVYFTRQRCTYIPCLSTRLNLRFSYHIKIEPTVVSILFK